MTVRWVNQATSVVQRLSAISPQVPFRMEPTLIATKTLSQVKCMYR